MVLNVPAAVGGTQATAGDQEQLFIAVCRMKEEQALSLQVAKTSMIFSRRWDFESEEERLKSRWRNILCCCTKWTTVTGGITHDGKGKGVIPAWVKEHSLGQGDADRERHHCSRDGGTIKIWMQMGYYLWLLCWHLMSTLMSCQKQCS